MEDEGEDKFSDADPMVKGTDHNFREQLRSLPVNKGETDKEYAKENVEKIKFQDQNAPAEHGSTTCEMSAEAGKDEFESGTDTENKSVKPPEKGILARESIRETTETMSESMSIKSTNIAEDRSLVDFMIKECSNVQLNAILTKDFSEGDSTKKDGYLTSELERKQLADSKMKIKSTDSEAKCMSPGQKSCNEGIPKELDFAGSIDNQRLHVEFCSINESRNESTKQVADLKCESMSLNPTLEHASRNCEQRKVLHGLDSAKDKNIGESELKNVTTENKYVEQDSATEAQSSKKVQSTEDGSESSIQICPQILVNLDKSPCSMAPTSYSRALLPYSPPPGLGNMGNSCYINAVMQCLAVCFQDSLIFEKIERRKTEVGGLAYWFFKVIQDIKNNKKGPNSGLNISLTNLKREMGQISSKYTSYGQQDAFEFLMFIFKNVMKTLKSVNLDVISDTFAFKMRSTLVPNTCRHTQTKLQVEYALILSPAIQVDCSIFKRLMQAIYNEFRIIFDLEPSVEQGLKVEDLLERFLKKENHCDIFCPNCSVGLNKGTMEFCLESLPDILIIYINRYNALKSNKLDESIEVKLNNFEVKYSGGLGFYSAIAYCEHSGTLKSGHYTAHVRDYTGVQQAECKESLWYICNDSSINQCRLKGDSIMSRDVYMIFYRRVHVLRKSSFGFTQPWI